MAEFASAFDYERFEKSIYRKARFVHDVETREFLKTVMETSKPRVVPLEKESKLWRAQLGSTPRMQYPDTDHEFEVPSGHQPERMKPKAELIGDGRVNPRGIPCLYLATDGDTAMAEVRPWVSAEISLALFIVLRDCKVVDCSRDKRRSLRFSFGKKLPELTAQQKEAEVWGEIAHAFSKPVTPKEPIADYIPTQILAEAFRAHGLDGIVYKSELGKGYNVALFDIEAADLMMCGLHDTKAVEYKFEQADNPYYVKKYYPETVRTIEEQESSAATVETTDPTTMGK